MLDGDALVYHGVKSISVNLTPRDRLDVGRRIVLRAIRDFRPNVLAIEKAFFAKSRNTALLNVLADEIVSLARRKGIEVRAVAPSTVKKRIAGNGHATKRAVAASVIARYPELKVYRGQDRKWKEQYHGNMFDVTGRKPASLTIDR